MLLALRCLSPMLHGHRCETLRAPEALRRGVVEVKPATCYADPSNWRDHAGAVVEPTRDGERAARDTPCLCGLPLREHSPHWPHDSVACNAFQQRPGTDRLRPEPGRAKALRLPPLPHKLDAHALEGGGAVIRAQLLDALRGLSSKRTAACRSKRLSSVVQVHRDGDRVAIRGLETCGSVWACPCCAARIYATRAHELTEAFRLWQGAEPSMLTFTVRHGAGDRLKTLRRGLAKAWEYLWRGRAGMARRKKWGLRSWVRAIEVSRGKNGWHPHIHAFVFTMQGISDADRRELSLAWRRAVVRALGFRWRPSVAHGVDVKGRRASKAYLTKLGLEISAITKTGRGDGYRSPWQLAHEAARGDLRSAALWQEYCRGMHGARQLTWSRGTRVRFGLKDVSDEAASDEPEVCALLVKWEGKTWDRLRYAPGWLGRVTRAAHAESPLCALATLPGAQAIGPPGFVRHPRARGPTEQLPLMGMSPTAPREPSPRVFALVCPVVPEQLRL